MTKAYKKKDGTIINYEGFPMPENSDDLFRINIPKDLKSYESGNGEGYLGYCSPEDKKKYDADEESGEFIVVLDNCEGGTVVLAEFRGNHRPIAVFEELKRN